MKSVKLQCQGGQHAQPPYTYEILNASVSFKHMTYATDTNKFITPSIGTTTTSPVYYYYEFHELSSIRLPMIIAFTIMATACVLRLLAARIQTTEVPRCFSNFITPNIVTTMTSLVFYFYEFDELSTTEHKTSAFQLQLSWTMTIIVVTAYVLMIAANGILLQTKVGNFYMSTQWPMESTFVKLLLIV